MSLGNIPLAEYALRAMCMMDQEGSIAARSQSSIWTIKQRRSRTALYEHPTWITRLGQAHLSGTNSKDSVRCLRNCQFGE